jgi:hypothetical protein
LPNGSHLKDASLVTAVIYIIYTKFTPKIQRKIENLGENILFFLNRGNRPGFSVSPSDDSIGIPLQKPHFGPREKSNPAEGRV